MDEYGERCEVDRLSNLPESLIFEILLKLPTKHVVKTSVLSSRWKNLWRYVPGLDLKRFDFSENDAFVSFVDRFLSFSSGSCMQNFKLKYDWDNDENINIAHVTRWINTVVERKVQHLFILERFWFKPGLVISPVMYTCESLVSLKLCGLTLSSPKFVSLPSLKFMVLTAVTADDLTLETLVSRCPILESLSIHRSLVKKTKGLRVCSQSLLDFTYFCANNSVKLSGEELVVAIDAPRLEHLSLHDGRTSSFILKNPASLVDVDINIDFNLGSAFAKKLDPNDVTKRNMIRDFLVGISSVKDMSITTQTLDVIYDYSKCEQLSLFRNLSTLWARFYDCDWEMLPIFLESCPNLKNLIVEFGTKLDTWTCCPKSTTYLDRERTNTRCSLPSLEYVKIESPLKGEAMEMKLVSYLLEKSTILKELTLCLDDSIKNEEYGIVKEVLNMPKLSSSCYIVFSE